MFFKYLSHHPTGVGLFKRYGFITFTGGACCSFNSSQLQHELRSNVGRRAPHQLDNFPIWPLRRCTVRSSQGSASGSAGVVDAPWCSRRAQRRPSKRRSPLYNAPAPSTQPTGTRPNAQARCTASLWHGLTINFLAGASLRQSGPCSAHDNPWSRSDAAGRFIRNAQCRPWFQDQIAVVQGRWVGAWRSEASPVETEVHGFNTAGKKPNPGGSSAHLRPLWVSKCSEIADNSRWAIRNGTGVFCLAGGTNCADWLNYSPWTGATIFALQYFDAYRTRPNRAARSFGQSEKILLAYRAAHPHLAAPRLKRSYYGQFQQHADAAENDSRVERIETLSIIATARARTSCWVIVPAGGVEGLAVFLLPESPFAAEPKPAGANAL